MTWKTTGADPEALYNGTEFPSLDLKFADNKTLVDEVSGDNLITFTRSSIGTYVDANGVIQTASADTPRFDHDPVTGESLGLLIEESRTNLFAYSTDLTQWIASNSALPLASSEIAPDGSTDAYILNINSVIGSYFSRSVPTVAGNVYTISVWAKNVPGEQNFFDLFFNSVNVVQLGKTALTDTWTRYHITGTASQTGNVLAGINNPPDDYAARGLFWGFQFEQGSFPTSYIPTSGSTVTRAADVARIAGSNFSSWYNQSEGTCFVSGDKPFTGNWVNYRSFFRVYNYASPANNYISYGTTNGANIANYWQVNTGGVSQLNYSAYNIANSFKHAIAIATNDAAFYGTGSSTVTAVDTSLTLPTVNEASIETVNSHISRLTYYPYRLSNARLQTITT